jgi:diaminopimelate decarboxylase
MVTAAQLPLLESRKTPFYAYNTGLLRQTLDACMAEARKYDFHVHYALKANSNPKLAAVIAGKGFGADCVSGNEVRFALENGFSSAQTVFAGVGKSDAEILFALEHDILCFNSESTEEIEIINQLAGSLGKKASIALRINPNVNAQTHHYITTGLEENKFGINQHQLPELLVCAAHWKNVEIIGLHFHIGSQITDLEVFKNLCTRVNEFNKWFDDHNIRIRILNVGGGLGVDYVNPEKNPVPDFAPYFELFSRFLEKQPYQEVHFELGRALVAHCGDLISRVLYIKTAIKTKFMILDAGMTELLRPALYQAKHSINNLSKEGQVRGSVYDVVGPVCESSDCFGKNIDLPESGRGDLIAIRTAGAYGEVMASGYNLRKLEEPLFY